MPHSGPWPRRLHGRPPCGPLPTRSHPAPRHARGRSPDVDGSPSAVPARSGATRAARSQPPRSPKGGDRRLEGCRRGVNWYGLFGAMITLTAFRRLERWAFFSLWYYPVFWTAYLVGNLPPGRDHIHQVAFIVLSLIGLLLPVREFFPRSADRT